MNPMAPNPVYSLADKQPSLCGSCGASKKKTLYTCGGCRDTQYCVGSSRSCSWLNVGVAPLTSPSDSQSFECQQKEWNAHKVCCKQNVRKRTSLHAMSSAHPSPISSREYSLPLAQSTSVHPTNPNHYAWAGLTPAASLASLRKWCHSHHPVLTRACKHALGLAHHPSHGTSNIFLVMLELTRPTQDRRETRPAQMFVIRDARAIRKEALATMWPRIGEAITKVDQENAKMDRKEGGKELAMMLVQCGAHVNLMPCYWDRKDLAGMPEDRDWKTVLQEETEGK